jgi:pimeloyl-ACP methyl ester carboxylesterase
MHSIVRFLRASLQLSIVVVIGVLLIVLRYIIKTPQLLTSKITGEGRFSLWNGNKVFFQVVGPQAGPVLVLLHTPEIGGSAYEMRKLVPELARRYRVYVPDLPGFGLSDHPAQSYRASTYEAFLQSFLHEVVMQPATLVASGLSAQFCLALADSHPELVEKLVLLTSFSSLQLEQKPLSAQTSAILHTTVGAFIAYALLTSKPILRRVMAWQHQQELENVGVDELHYFYASTHQPGAQYAACAWLAGDLQSQLPKSTPPCPTLLIQGEKCATSADRSNTALQIENIAGAGLRVHEEQPEQVLKIIQQAEILQPTAEPNVEEGRSLSEASEPVVEAYCVKCKQKRNMVNPRQTTTKNGRRAMEGICPICSTRLFRFI